MKINSKRINKYKKKQTFSKYLLGNESLLIYEYKSDDFS
jgi:hypothetical protein